MNLASMVPQLFPHCVQAKHMTSILDMMVRPAFAHQQKDAKFKLLQLTLTLQKIRVGSFQKGFAGEKNTWLYEVNHLAYKALKDADETTESGRDLVKHMKRILKFIKKEVSPLRQSLYSQLASVKDPESKIKTEAEAKRVLALEKLFLSLVLMTAASGDEAQELEQISD